MKMHLIRLPLSVIGLAILVVALIIMMRQTFSREVPAVSTPLQSSPSAEFKLSSPAFATGQAIPAAYTCNGANINPPLTIDNPPGGTETLALVVREQDAEKNPTHWIVWNIPVDTATIAEHSVPVGGVQGVTDFAQSGWSGMCPAKGSGKHSYIFEIYALNEKLTLEPSKGRDGLSAAMNGKVIGKTQLVGTVTSAP